MRPLNPEGFQGRALISGAEVEVVFRNRTIISQGRQYEREE